MLWAGTQLKWASMASKADPEAFFASLMNLPPVTVKRRGSAIEPAAAAAAFQQEEWHLNSDRIDMLETLAEVEAKAADAEKAKTANALQALESSLARMREETAQREAAQAEAMSRWMAEAEAKWAGKLGQLAQSHRHEALHHHVESSRSLNPHLPLPKVSHLEEKVLTLQRGLDKEARGPAPDITTLRRHSSPWFTAGGTAKGGQCASRPSRTTLRQATSGGGRGGPV